MSSKVTVDKIVSQVCSRIVQRILIRARRHRLRNATDIFIRLSEWIGRLQGSGKFREVVSPRQHSSRLRVDKGLPANRDVDLAGAIFWWVLYTLLFELLPVSDQGGANHGRASTS